MILNTVAIILLVSTTAAALLRCCLPGELMHRLVSPIYEWVQLHRPAWLPEKLTWCVFCSAFWFLGIPAMLLSCFWLQWYALLIPLPLAVLTEHFTARFFRR